MWQLKEGKQSNVTTEGKQSDVATEGKEAITAYSNQDKIKEDKSTSGFTLILIMPKVNVPTIAIFFLLLFF